LERYGNDWKDSERYGNKVLLNNLHAIYMYFNPFPPSATNDQKLSVTGRRSKSARQQLRQCEVVHPDENLLGEFFESETGAVVSGKVSGRKTTLDASLEGRNRGEVDGVSPAICLNKAKARCQPVGDGNRENYPKKVEIPDAKLDIACVVSDTTTAPRSRKEDITPQIASS